MRVTSFASSLGSIVTSSLMHPLQRPIEIVETEDGALQIKLINAIALMTTFGLMFPPLAVVICVSIWSETVFEQLLMEQLLLDAASKGDVVERVYRQQMERYMQDLRKPFDRELLLLLQSIIAILFAFIVFDILGDSAGWKAGLSAAGALLGAALTVTACYYCWCKRRMLWSWFPRMERRMKEKVLGSDDSFSQSSERDVELGASLSSMVTRTSHLLSTVNNPLFEKPEIKCVNWEKEIKQKEGKKEGEKKDKKKKMEKET